MTFIPKRKRKLSVFLIFLMGLTHFFQNCSNSSYSIQYLMDQLNRSQTFGPNGEVQVEGGEYTNNLTVYIQPVVDASTHEIAITSRPNCENNHQWQPISRRVPWTLETPNSLNYFWVQFRNASGAVSNCIEAHITHDDIAPQLSVLTRPSSFSSQHEETMTFSAQDDGSGILSYLCKKENESLFISCENVLHLNDLQDGKHQVSLSAVDRAGNIASAIHIEWTVDTIPPVVRFARVPDRISNQSTTSIEFEGSDNSNGSGIDYFECQLNSKPWEKCTSPLLFSQLAEGQHQISLRARDHSGNISTTESAQWTLDQTSPKKFEVLGVTSVEENQIDAYLVAHPTPQVHWSSSEEAILYQVAIRHSSESSPEVCPTSTTRELNFRFNSETCQLQHGQRYIAHVIALDSAQNSHSQNLAFTVDLKGLSIHLGEVNTKNSQNEVWIPLSIESVVPLQNLTCTKVDTVTNIISSWNCLGSSEIHLELPVGSYQIYAEGKTNIGTQNRSNIVNVLIKETICNPLKPNLENCKFDQGWIGDLFYLNREQSKNPPHRSSQIIEIGKQVPVQIRMGQINVPTRPFTEGFLFSDLSKAKDESGNLLIEWFALRLKSYLKLGQAQPGYYQLALLSDDGSLLKISSSENSAVSDQATNSQILIDNEGNHPTRLGCAKEAIYLDANTLRHLEIQYYQGPRHHIALVLMWKYLGSSKNIPAEPLCGKSGNDLYYGPHYNDFDHFKFAELIKKGWQVIPTESFTQIQNHTK